MYLILVQCLLMILREANGTVDMAVDKERNRERLFISYEGYALEGSVTAVYQVNSPLQCASHFMRDSRFKSFNVKATKTQGKLRCELNNAKKNEKSSFYVNTVGSTYYEAIQTEPKKTNEKASHWMCRNLKIDTIVEGKALVNHSISTIRPIKDRDTCASLCYLELQCFTFNFCESKSSGSLCELLDSDHLRHGEDLVEKADCTYYGSKTSCSSNPCFNNATCQGDFSMQDKPYRCVCTSGFTGQNCEKDIDECESGDHGCHVYGTCNNTIGGYECHWPSSCEELKQFLPNNATTGFYEQELENGDMAKVFCSYESYSGCGEGPWTLVMKINGSKNNFGYYSSHWNNPSVFNPDGSDGGLDEEETVSPAYWSTPLTKLCLGMKYNNTLKWILIDVKATSLYDIMANETEIRTQLRENKWRSLLTETSLQDKCNIEGFNLKCGSNRHNRRLRLGFFANNEDDCSSCDSFIGLGSVMDGHKVLVCGNYANHGGDKGNLNIAAFCYILIQ